MEGDSSQSSLQAITVEKTLAIIKPDAVDEAEPIFEDIKDNGFTILQVVVAILHQVMNQNSQCWDDSR